MWTTGQEQRTGVQPPIHRRCKQENEGKACEHTMKYPVGHSSEMCNESADSNTAEEQAVENHGINKR
jgi:hypothetical protein